jgi:hypothetical protein
MHAAPRFNRLDSFLREGGILQMEREPMPVLRCRARAICFLVASALAFPLSASASVTLTPDLPSGQPVGTRIHWTAASTDTDPVDFRLSVTTPGGVERVVYDFSALNVFEWTSIDDGSFDLTLAARNRVTGVITTATESFSILSRVTTGPVVTPTDNPLVAFYSAPPCNIGWVHVAFQRQSGGRQWITAARPCRAGRSLNFYVAGMTADTTYVMRHRRFIGGLLVEQGPIMNIHTGLVGISVPAATVLEPADLSTSPEGIVLHSAVTGTDPALKFPLATDLGGQIVWYYDGASEVEGTLLRPVDGGTFLLTHNGETLADQVLRELDLAGNTLRYTTATRVTEQLADMGFPDAFTSFHHEARRLPDGRTVVLGSLERLLTDVQGPGTVDVLSDYVVVLDENWQVVWAWHGFDHLDVTRVALMNEKCISQGPGCPPVLLAPQANDWLHSNAIAYSPADGDLIVSMRHQDWVIKIDYSDGAGDGHVVWRLGPDGDFTLDPPDPFGWFTHQHDPNYAPGNDTLLAVFDNGNTRCANGGGCFSRGQVFQLDETAMTATTTLSADLGSYSSALGSAQALANGNFHFNSGFQTPPNFKGSSDEMRLDGTKSFSLQMPGANYRTFRMRHLYDIQE